MADEQKCESCNSLLERILSVTQFHATYQPGLFMSNGEFVPGHIGKSAKRQRKK